MGWIERFSTWTGMMFETKTSCEANVFNLELYSCKKQFKDGMKTDLLKCQLPVDAGALFWVI